METCKANFYKDKEKMHDFFILSKEEFLQSYSYLTEEEYDNTKQIVDEECLMSPQLFDKVKARLQQMLADSVKYCLACIYDLFEDYLISSEQEVELYNIADPNEKFNEVSEYYEKYIDDKNPLKATIGWKN